jgi:hypothetical protein
LAASVSFTSYFCLIPFREFAVAISFAASSISKSVFSSCFFVLFAVAVSIAAFCLSAELVTLALSLEVS